MLLLEQLVEAIDTLPDNTSREQMRLRALETGFWLQQTILEAVGALPEPEEAPKRGRGRPRTRSASERAVTEYYDEEAGEWVRAGRGRPPKGAETRKVDPESGAVVEG